MTDRTPATWLRWPEPPAEVWCERCDQPSVRTVSTSTGDHALCERHAVEREYKTTSTAWAPKSGDDR